MTVFESPVGSRPGSGRAGRSGGEGHPPWIEFRVTLQDPENLGEFNFGGVLTGWMSPGRNRTEPPGKQATHPVGSVVLVRRQA